MKVTITGWNYEGARFRGIASNSDEVMHNITLVGEDEKLLCDWILESYSYGPIGDVQTLHDLVKGYDSCEISNADGCGGVAQIIVGDEIMYQVEEFLEEVFTAKPLEMGEHVVHATVDLDTLNKMIREAI